MLLFNSKLVPNKNLHNSLHYIFGLGRFYVSIIFKRAGFSSILKIKDLLNEQLTKIIKIVNLLNILISYSLKKCINFILKNIINIKSVKGYRLLKGLPVRGQRTKTNSKTSRNLKFIMKFEKWLKMVKAKVC